MLHVTNIFIQKMPFACNKTAKFNFFRLFVNSDPKKEAKYYC